MWYLGFFLSAVASGFSVNSGEYGMATYFILSAFMALAKEITIDLKKDK